MSVKSIVGDAIEFIRARIYLISWISLVIYLFYDTFIYYRNGRQFYYLRRILGLSLCVSRATATILNVCSALILLPQCKKINQILYRIMSKLWPRLFFIWLEKAKSFHMTVATTLVMFGVLHSISHFVNLWNFSRDFDEVHREINFANYKNENPLFLLLSMAGVTGMLMLLMTLCMGVTSLRVVRRKVYNAFWYAHQLYLPFMVLFLIHPLSGVLKEEVIDDDSNTNPSQFSSWTNSSTLATPKFIPIKSKTWLWMSLPLSCFFLDLLWRICTRNSAAADILEIVQCQPVCDVFAKYPHDPPRGWNLARASIALSLEDRQTTGVDGVLQVKHMSGRTISLTISYISSAVCRSGQYVLLQCPQLSLIEWHPFTLVKVPTSYQKSFVVWIRVKGDWTEAFEKMLKENGPRDISILVDGPFSSPLEAVSRSRVALCVAAGVGITPFVSVIQHIFLQPRSPLPWRVHLIWIVRHEQELTWLAELANSTIAQLRDANRPDRLHIELYVTGRPKTQEHKSQNSVSHIVAINDKGCLTHVLNKTDDEKATLLTPHLKRAAYNNIIEVNDNNYNIAKDYPMLGCRVKRGRPHWDRVFGYWVHLYPKDRLNLYCCGPKKLVKVLKNKCIITSRSTKTNFTFVHEGF